MTIFGFVVGTVLVNTLFLFDLFVTQYQVRSSLWGSTMTFVAKTNKSFLLIPLWSAFMIWIPGIFSDNIYPIHVLAAIVFWIYIAVLYTKSTFLYYKLKLNETKNERLKHDK